MKKKKNRCLELGLRYPSQHILGSPSSYMTLRHAPFWISLYMRKIIFFFCQCTPPSRRQHKNPFYESNPFPVRVTNKTRKKEKTASSTSFEINKFAGSMESLWSMRNWSLRNARGFVCFFISNLNNLHQRERESGNGRGLVDFSTYVGWGGDGGNVSRVVRIADISLYHK